MKEIGTTLIVWSFFIFLIYILLAFHCPQNGGWGFGIWLFSVGVFVTGVLFKKDEK